VETDVQITSNIVLMPISPLNSTLQSLAAVVSSHAII
jgi:hypothetical protein